MAFTKIEHIKHLTKTEVANKILEIKKEIFELKMQRATRQSIKTHLFKHKKCELAQLLTLETQKLK